MANKKTKWQYEFDLFSQAPVEEVFPVHQENQIHEIEKTTDAELLQNVTHPVNEDSENISSQFIPVPPNLNFYGEESTQVTTNRENAIQQIQKTLDAVVSTPLNYEKFQHIAHIHRRYPGIYFTPAGTFDLERMKIENDFLSCMDMLWNIHLRRYPYNNEYLPENHYLYEAVDQLIQQRADKEDMTKVREWEAILIHFFGVLWTLFTEKKSFDLIKSDPIFWFTKIIASMDFMWTEHKKYRTKHDDHTFDDWFDRQFKGEYLTYFDNIKALILEIVKKQNPTITKLILEVPQFIEMFKAHANKGIHPVEFFERSVLRENLLAVNIPEGLREYTSDKVSSKYGSRNDIIEIDGKVDFLAMIKKIGLRATQDIVKTMLHMPEPQEIKTIRWLYTDAWLHGKLQEIIEQQWNICNFFSMVEWAIRKLGYGDILDKKIKSDVYWDTIKYCLDMILGGSELLVGKEDFLVWFRKEYGEENPLGEPLWEGVQLAQTKDVLPLILEIKQFIVPMFASFLEKKTGEGIVDVFKRHALSEYLQSIAPKPRILNFRAKRPLNNKRVISPEILQKNEIIKATWEKIALEECSEKIKTLILKNNISWIRVSRDGKELIHGVSWLTFSLSSLYLTPEKEWITLINKFLEEDVAEALLAKEVEFSSPTPLEKIEILPAVQDELRKTLNTLSIDWLILDFDTQLLEYQGHTISLSEIILEWAYEINIKLRMAEFDGTFDTVIEESHKRHKETVAQFQNTTHENSSYDTNEEECFARIETIVQSLVNDYPSLKFSREEKTLYMRRGKKSLTELWDSPDAYQQKIEDWLGVEDLPF